ncbi:MAG: DNA translocase FtsK 4TM domain-containing protein [bacterium]
MAKKRRGPGRPPKKDTKKKSGRGPGRPPKNEMPPGFNWALNLSPATKKSIFVIIFAVLALITLLSLFDLAGVMGEFWNDLIYQVFGWTAVTLPILFAFIAYAKVRAENMEITKGKVFGIIIFYIGLTGLLHVFYDTNELLNVARDGKGGGYIGYATAYPLMSAMGFWAALIIYIAAFLAGMFMMFNLSIQQILEKLNIIKDKSLDLSSKGVNAIKNVSQKAMPKGDVEIKEISDGNEVSEEEVEAEFSSKDIDMEEETEENLPVVSKKKSANWKPFPLDLLERRGDKPTSGDIHTNTRKIQQTLANFGIDVEMSDVSVGPTVTQYSLKPATGVKINQIVTLQNDIALALAAHPIRIEAPIPGKALVGIEVPNQSVATVRLREILETKEFENRRTNLSVVLGRDVAGKPKIADLFKMPHLLIAGATGSGKSVCINTLILTLLYQNSPEDLKMILVDPKKVEMTNYNGLPHLLTPVVNEVDKTINALRWSVGEMDRRFQLLSETNSRDIESYNSKAKANGLPYIVIIIDELADLMVVAPNEVEAAIVRLAQMARAVGIHLVLATQRPSVNVITGLIKANITSRIAFTVASQIDSRTIIDTAGAEKLLGSGDMLYITSDLSKPRRIQGSLVSEGEVEKVTKFIKQEGEPDYLEEVTEKHSARLINGGSTRSDDNDFSSEDELYDEAKKTVLQADKASASFLQRRLRVGYARAARLLDMLEEEGIIGPGDGAKPREILVKQDQLGDDAPPSDLMDQAAKGEEDDASTSSLRHDSGQAAQDHEEDFDDDVPKQEFS